jgi:hypothetical protein
MNGFNGRIYFIDCALGHKWVRITLLTAILSYSLKNVEQKCRGKNPGHPIFAYSTFAEFDRLHKSITGETFNFHCYLTT